MSEKLVLLVHCIDTEGPLYESMGAKFERLKDLYGLTDIAPTRENFLRLQKSEIDLGGLEVQIAQTLSGHLTNYNESWDQIDAMLNQVLSHGFRQQMLDSFGGGWVYNWFILDHVGYEYNPRRRDIGYHNIFDHYRQVLEREYSGNDGFHWHFHPMSTYRDAHRCATSYVNSPELFQILSRKVIERQWFPGVFRAGFQCERPDSHWFLEQWIPFDISNMAVDDPAILDSSIDFRNGRSGDWRLAPSDWSIYQPSHDNYQLIGNCRRWIARALNVMNRIANLDQGEMDKAFARASSGKTTVVGMASHDFRDLGEEVKYIRGLVSEAQKPYPEVRFKFCEAQEAFQRVIWPNGIPKEEIDLEVRLNPSPKNDVPNLEVLTKRGKVFGPQPFLAIETRSRRFIHDNLDFFPSLDRWSYAFHADTIPLDDVKRIGIAANDQYGRNIVKMIELQN